MNHRISLATVFVLLMVISGCGGSNEPARLPDLGAIPMACYPAVVDLALYTNGAISCADRDGGACNIKEERDAAVDKLAECLKALP